MTETLTFLQENWLILSPILLGVILRLWPTEKNYDFIGMIFNILDKIIPNIRKNKNKTLFVLFFALSIVSCKAQVNGNFKTLRLVNVSDSTTVVPVNATIYYNEQTGKLKAYENGVWKDLISAGGGSGISALTAGNGTTVGSDLTSIDLGGTITDYTELTATTDGSEFFINFDPVGNQRTLFDMYTDTGNAGYIQLDVRGSTSNITSTLNLSPNSTQLNAAYGASLNHTLQFAPSGATFTDTQNTEGLRYGGDYTPIDGRSITAKAYNDDNYWRTGDNFSLDAALQVNTSTFSLREGTNEVHTFVNQNMTQMKTSQSGNTSVRYLIEMNRNSGVGIKIADNLDNIGLRYEADYSANLDDLTVPNWGAVKGQLGGETFTPPTAGNDLESVYWNNTGGQWSYFDPTVNSQTIGTGNVVYQNTGTSGLPELKFSSSISITNSTLNAIGLGASNNIEVGTAQTVFTSGAKAIYIEAETTAPTVDATGGFIYVNAGGDLVYKSPAGTVTVIALN